MYREIKTKAEAMKYRYGKSSSSGGSAYDPSKCAEEVSDNARWARYYQCKRKPGFGPDGLYCKQHDPEEIKRKDEKRHKKWEQEREENEIRYRRNNASQQLLEACKLCQSMLTVWSVDPSKSPNTVLSTLMPV